MFPLILDVGLSLCILGFLNRNAFIWREFESRTSPQYANAITITITSVDLEVDYVYGSASESLWRDFVDGTSVRIVRKEVGGRNFSLGGGLRDEVGVELFPDMGLKKRWGSNFIINYGRKR